MFSDFFFDFFFTSKLSGKKSIYSLHEQMFLILFIRQTSRKLRIKELFQKRGKTGEELEGNSVEVGLLLSIGMLPSKAEHFSIGLL